MSENKPGSGDPPPPEPLPSPKIPERSEESASSPGQTPPAHEKQLPPPRETSEPAASQPSPDSGKKPPAPSEPPSGESPVPPIAPQVGATRPEPGWLLLHDESCPFCWHEAHVTHQVSGGRTRLAAWTETENLEQVKSSGLEASSGPGRVLLLGPGGDRFEGAAARAKALLLRPEFQWVESLYRTRVLRPIIHGFLGPRPWGHQLGSGPNIDGEPCKRHRFARRPPPESVSTYRTSAHFFIHLLALVNMVAFFSLFVQVRYLIGEKGLLPAKEFIARVDQKVAEQKAFLEKGSLNDADKALIQKSNYQLQATQWCILPFRWVDDGDAGLRGVALGGGLLSVLILLRILPRLCLALQLLLYLSLATLCQSFLGFQWDNLLLENTLLALLLPMRSRRIWNPLASPRPCADPHPLVVFLMQWMLFRLYFESGVSKIMAGPKGGWFDLSAMKYYYDTAPLPTWVGWHFHNLSAQFHEWETLATLFLEILLPIFIFAGRPWRRGLLFIYTGLQLCILVTANYAFFNYLSLAVHLFLVDDYDWAWVSRAWDFLLGRPCRWMAARVGWKWRARAPIRVALPRWQAYLRTAFLSVAGVALLGASLILFALFVLGVPEYRPESPKNVLHTLHDLSLYYQPYRVVNVYHLFANMTRDRVMVEIEGSNDTSEWKPYRFHYAPGDLMRRPGFVAPHQPRLDFQLWFLAFVPSGVPSNYGRPLSHPYQFWYRTRQQAPAGREYFLNLLARLHSDPESVSYFFSEMPVFDNEPPKYLRLAFYNYHMSDPETYQKTGAYWVRKFVGYDNELIVRAGR